jgi:hypothetical protein
VIKHSTHANIPHETVENAFYDTINVEYRREYSTQTRRAQRVLKSVTEHMRKWHDKQMALYPNREWYVRSEPSITLSSDKKRIFVYARYQFADMDTVHAGS